MSSMFGRCLHCGDQMLTGGCSRCSSSKTYCFCGTLIECGCGLKFDHKCPSIVEPCFSLRGQPSIGDYVDAWLTSEELELPPEAFTLLKMKAEWRRARMRRHIAVGA